MGGSEGSGPAAVGTQKHMFALLAATHEAIQSEIFNTWYRANFPPIVDGVPKCAAGLYRYWRAEDGSHQDSEYGDLPSRETSATTVGRKVGAIVYSYGKYVTSAEARFVPENLQTQAKKVIWLGASQVSNGFGIDGDIDAWTGDPELVDHLKILTAQLLSGRLTEKDWWARSSLDWPGIWDAIMFASQFGMTADRYLLMRADIQDIMIPVAKQLNLAAA